MPATSAIAWSSSSCARRRNGAASRLHVACADADGNVELLMQAGFMRYGEERIMFRAPTTRCRGPPSDAAAAKARIRPTQPHRRPVAPAPLQRGDPDACRPDGGVRLQDWKRQGTHWRVPRSSLAPICCSPTSRPSSQATDGGGKDGTQLDAFLQVGVAKEDQPHYLKLIARPDADPDALIEYGLGIIAARTSRGGDRRPDHGGLRARANL